MAGAKDVISPIWVITEEPTGMISSHDTASLTLLNFAKFSIVLIFTGPDLTQKPAGSLGSQCIWELLWKYEKVRSQCKMQSGPMNYTCFTANKSPVSHNAYTCSGPWALKGTNVLIELI